MSLRKWDLAWAHLDPVEGHEQAGRRPVLVYCNDAISRPIGLVTVLPLTALKKGRRVYPTEVLLSANSSGLPQNSLVLAHQIRTLSAERLSPALGHIGDPALQDAIRRALGIWLDETG